MEKTVSRRQIIYSTPQFYREAYGDYLMAYGEWQDVSGNLLAICTRAPAIAGNPLSLCDAEVDADYLRTLVPVQAAEVPEMWMRPFRAFLA